MKLIHLADTHLGKRLNEFDMLEVQKAALDAVCDYVDAHAVDVVLIAGDVFDKTTPRIEALKAFEAFEERLVKSSCQLIVIAGNHDSAERLSFNAAFLDEQHVVIAQRFSNTPQFVDVQKNGEAVRLHLLPYIRPLDVRLAYADELGEHAQLDATEAIRFALSKQPQRADAFNIVLSHQFVTSQSHETLVSDSEQLMVGGDENVSVEAYDGFDYVALGHIHTPQSIGRPSVRYCGSLYPYSQSEIAHPKTMTVLTLAESAEVSEETSAPKSLTITEEALPRLHNMRLLHGSYEELYQTWSTESDREHQDYVYVELTDASLENAMDKMRQLYPHTLSLKFVGLGRDLLDKGQGQTLTHRMKQSPLDTVQQLIETQIAEELSADDRAYLADLVTSVFSEQY